MLTSLAGIDDPGRLADTISAHMSMALDEKQRILEISDIAERLAHLQSLMDAEIDVFQVENGFAAALRSRWRRVSASTI